VAGSAPRTGGTWAIVAGGGTAGHVLPGLAISRALVARGHPAGTIHFVGSERGIEARLVPEAGFPLTLLPGRGLERRLSFANVRAVAGIVRGIFRSIALVRRERPAVVIALGGYASVPCGLAAALWRVPIVVAEQNVVPGAANRLVARFARASAVSFPETPLPRPVVTGNPIRPEMLTVGRDADTKADARQALGLEEGRQVLVVFGGSLGALSLNRATLDAADAWRDRSDLALRHVIGARDWDSLQAALPEPSRAGLQYQPVRYEERMDFALAAADLVVCRSGSSTLFELAAAAMPSVLVPSPYVTADHQTGNARVLVAAGGAVMVPDREIDGRRLVAEVDALLADPERLAAMGRAAHTLARPDAADRVAALAEEYARA
jgi:undecaprenyldiphospho-muramoylpentapeptide beta-N-acetylglucosaminyltransferase